MLISLILYIYGFVHLSCVFQRGVQKFLFQPLAGLTNQPLVRLSISGTPLLPPSQIISLHCGGWEGRVVEVDSLEREVHEGGHGCGGCVERGSEYKSR